MPYKPVLEISDIELVICEFFNEYFSDITIEQINNVRVVGELPKNYNKDTDFIVVVKKIADNSLHSNFYRLQSVGFNCFAPTWSLARKLAIRVEAVMNSSLFINGSKATPVYNATTTTGPIKSGSFTDSEAKVYYTAIQFTTKSNQLT